MHGKSEITNRYDGVKKYCNYLYLKNVKDKNKTKLNNIRYIGIHLIYDLARKKVDVPCDLKEAIPVLDEIFDKKYLTLFMKKRTENLLKGTSDKRRMKELVKTGHIQDTLEDVFNIKLDRYETGLYTPQKVICECGKETKFVDSACIYHGVSYGYIYICPQCGRYVGVHKGTNYPLGTPADKELQELRKKVHKKFDSTWSTQKERSQAYKVLSKQLNINIEETHIGMFDKTTCENVLKLLTEK